MKALAATAAVLMTLLAGAVSWFAISADPLDGEPYAVVKLETVKAAAPDRANTPAAPSASVGRNATPPAGQAPANTTNVPRKTPGGENADGDQPPPGLAVIGMRTPGLTARPQQPAANDASVSGQITLTTAPVEALVEESRYGPLPKVSEDGRRPSKIYARPSRYTALPRSGEPARIAILISGMGLSELATTEAINKLPGAVTLAFGPYGRNLQGWVRQARSAGHEVMLQVPLEPFDYPDNDPGPHTLLTNLPPEENMKRLQWLMARFTGYTGITNHMGAKFAAAPAAFQPVLEQLKSRGLIYLDDGSSTRSAAGQIARQLGLGYAAAQVAIDSEASPEDIERALAKLETMAKENGLAIGVGTSLPVTIQQVSKWSKTLGDKNVVLIPVSAAVTAQHQS